MHEHLGGVILPDTRNTVVDTTDPGNPSHAAPQPVDKATGGGGVCATVDESLDAAGGGYRIRILEPVEVSSPMEVHVYPDRASAIDIVNQIATKLTLRGFTSYRINILDPNDHTVWTMKREARHGG